jgi:hypothetical protein
MATPTGGSLTMSVDVVGENTQERYAGVFHIQKFLPYRKQLQRDAMRRELMGKLPEQAVIGAVYASVAFSEMAVRIIQAPTWWKESDGGLDLEDTNVVEAVFNAMTEELDKIAKKDAKDTTDAQARLKKTADKAEAQGTADAE